MTFVMYSLFNLPLYSKVQYLLMVYFNTEVN